MSISTARILARCLWCGEDCILEVRPVTAIAYVLGMSIEEAFSDQPGAIREFLRIGVCPWCQS